MIFKGFGLFVYSDPGAAKAVLSQILQIKEGLTGYKVYSNRDFSFTESFGLKTETGEINIAQVFDSYQPDFLFTGTSYTNDFELKFIDEASKRNIPSYSYIDHYVLFLERFCIENRVIYPNTILVIDERAKRLAIAEGIPSEKIQIFGNPYYGFLVKYRPSISREVYLKSIGVKDYTKRLIVFAPEPLSNINGKEKYGFDEVEAITEVKKILDEGVFDCQFIFKPHPNQDMQKIENLISEKFLLLNSESDANALIYFSNIVIGFFSNFLIEAHWMRKKILRLQILPVENDPLKELNIGKVVDINMLKRELECLS